MPKKGNNEGSVYKDKRGRWTGSVTLPSVNGKVRKKYFYGKTKKEVSDKVNSLLMEIKNNTYIEPCKTTLYEWLCTWLETYSKNTVRPTTYINYETYVHKHIKAAIGGIRLCDLSPIVIQQFYNEKLKNGKLNSNGGLSSKTMKNLHNMLHKALSQAVVLNLINRNPTDSAVIPKSCKKEMRYFTVDEQKKLQQILPFERLGIVVLLDLYTGMRQGELLGLMWENVHIDLNGDSYIKVVQTVNRIRNTDPESPRKTMLTLNEPKTSNSVRTIPLLPEIAEKLYNHKAEQEKFLKEHSLPITGFVFTSANGNMIDPRDFQRDFKKLLKKHDIREINVHGLRHTFATRALESGMSVKTLSKILGHSNVGFTLDTYAHVTENLKVEAISEMQHFLD